MFNVHNGIRTRVEKKTLPVESDDSDGGDDD